MNKSKKIKNLTKYHPHHLMELLSCKQIKSHTMTFFKKLMKVKLCKCHFGSQSTTGKKVRYNLYEYPSLEKFVLINSLAI